ncbi:MAG: hypothetical protein ACKN9U_03885, partial [Pirellulaceae bacterium]
DDRAGDVVEHGDYRVRDGAEYVFRGDGQQASQRSLRFPLLWWIQRSAPRAILAVEGTQVCDLHPPLRSNPTSYVGSSFKSVLGGSFRKWIPFVATGPDLQFR